MIRRISILIVFIIICLFSCCGLQQKVTLPSDLGSKININTIRIYVDDEFTTDETNTITNALNAWQKVSNKYIIFNYYYHQLKPGKIESFFWTKQYKRSIFVWKISSKDMSENFDEKTTGFVGFWDLHGNILIFSDRISQVNNTLYNITVHESGHMLGLKHIEYEQSVMNPIAYYISNCITKDDAERLCLIYGCKPKPECD